jgi:hypothetical protein
LRHLTPQLDRFHPGHRPSDQLLVLSCDIFFSPGSPSISLAFLSGQLNSKPFFFLVRLRARTNKTLPCPSPPDLQLICIPLIFQLLAPLEPRGSSHWSSSHLAHILHNAPNSPGRKGLPGRRPHPIIHHHIRSCYCSHFAEGRQSKKPVYRCCCVSLDLIMELCCTPRLPGT